MKTNNEIIKKAAEARKFISDNYFRYKNELEGNNQKSLRTREDWENLCVVRKKAKQFKISHKHINNIMFGISGIDSLIFKYISIISFCNENYPGWDVDLDAIEAMEGG